MRYIVYTFVVSLLLIACSSHKKQSVPQVVILQTNQDLPFVLEFEAGKYFNNPTFAVWIEDMNETLVSTIFVTKSIATGKYGHAYSKDNIWLPDSGISIRPATLPYWLHKQTNGNIHSVSPQNPLVPDAVSGATPKGSFTIETAVSKQLPNKFRVLLEINQAWDWNEYYTNAEYPGNFEYKTSCQPSVIYAVTIDLQSPIKTYYLQPIGHGHYAGEDGLLYTDLRGHTTALQIAKSISVQLKK